MIHFQGYIWSKKVENSALHHQGSYASGKRQGNLKIFKVRELSGILCCVREK